jgi:hypothetical protein
MAYTATLGTSGTTAAFASDIIVMPGVTTAHYPQIKFAWGADGTATPWSDANPPPFKGSANSFSVNLVTTTGPYSIGDVVGGPITITPAARTTGGSAIINTVTLGCTSAAPLLLWLWNADLVGAAVADNAPMVVTATDAAKYLGTVPIVAGDYSAPTTNALNFASLKGVGLQYETVSMPTIIGYLTAMSTNGPVTTQTSVGISMEFLD